jgi:uncharacterized protein (UPF0332 family)
MKNSADCPAYAETLVKNARERLETAKKHFEERQYRDALVTI